MTEPQPWRNWAGTVTARPARVVRPRTVDELVAEVRRAAADGLRVRAVGAGHSFTDAAVTEGVMVDVSVLDRAVVDTATRQVTVEGGSTLRRLNRRLAAHGLAMANLGDIDLQTVSGALATGTHGTGLALGGLATQVTALELVLADGSLVRCAADERPELFAAALVGLGAYGVVATVTLQCVPAFLLHARETPLPLQEVLEAFDELAAVHDHVEAYWFPHTDRALLKRNDRVPDDIQRQPRSWFRSFVDDEVLANAAYGAAQRMVARRPGRWAPRLQRLAASTWSTSEHVDHSYAIFCSPRRVRFVEMEYAVPRAALVDVVRDLKRWVEAEREPVSFPVELRVAAADDIWLSTAHGRETAYVAVHQYHRLPHERWFAHAEAVATAVGGRPHWGKLHGLDAESLAGRYPRFADAVRVRRERRSRGPVRQRLRRPGARRAGLSTRAAGLAGRLGPWPCASSPPSPARSCCRCRGTYRWRSGPTTARCRWPAASPGTSSGSSGSTTRSTPPRRPVSRGRGASTGCCATSAGSTCRPWSRSAW